MVGDCLIFFVFAVVCHLLEGMCLSIVDWTMWTLKDLPKILDLVT